MAQPSLDAGGPMPTRREVATSFLDFNQLLLRLEFERAGVSQHHRTRAQTRTISQSRALTNLQSTIDDMERALSTWGAPPPVPPKRRRRPPPQQQRPNNRTEPYARPPTTTPKPAEQFTPRPLGYRIDPEINFSTTFHFQRPSLLPFKEPICGHKCECVYSALCAKTVSLLKSTLIPDAPPTYILRSFLRHALAVEYGVQKDHIPELPMHIRNIFIYLAYHKLARTHFELKSQNYAFNKRDVGFDSVLGALRTMQAVLTEPTYELGLDLGIVSRHIICYGVRYYLKGQGNPKCHLLDRNSWAFGLAAEAKFDVLAKQTVEDKEMIGVVFSGDNMTADDLVLKDAILKAWTAREAFWFSELRRKITGNIHFKMSRFRAEDGKDHFKLITRDRALEELWGIGEPAGVILKTINVSGIGKIEVDSFGLWCQWLGEGQNVLGRL